jgi:UDP-2,3-diacylglucosamine pyrophosphatase LpxH
MRLGAPVFLAVAGGAGLAGVAAAWPGLPGPLLAGLGAGAGAWALDALLARDADTPLHRRHLAAFVLGAALAACASLRGARVDPASLAAGITAAGAALALGVLPCLRGRSLGVLSWRRGSPRRPDPARPLVLVADPHWGPTVPDGGFPGLEAVRRALPRADWLFLGDVFDVWAGLPGMETPAQRAFRDWVRERRAEGCWVGLWLGNREYFLDAFAGEFDLMGEGTGGGLPEEGLAFEHGDWINAADWRYRLWNLLSRSGPSWLCFRLLPGALARRLAAALERRLRTTNAAYKLAFPAAAFAAAAEAAPGRCFLTGHFHTHERAGKGIALPWAHGGAFWVWREGHAEPLAGPEASTPAPPEAPRG